MIGIVAHTARADEAHQLMESVGAAYMSIDNGQLGCEKNHHKTWAWLAEHCKDEYAVVLEDDAQPVPDFKAQLAQALEISPEPIVSLYLGKKRPPHWQSAIQQATQQATKHDASYITAQHLLHAVGVAIHTELLKDMLDHTRNTIRPWDYAIGAYAQQHGHGIAYTWPSLVDHQDADTVTRHKDNAPRTPGRKAWWAGTREVWTPVAVSMP